MNIRYLVLPIALIAPIGFANAQHPMILERLNQWNNAGPVPQSSVLKAEIQTKTKAIYGASAACSNSETVIDKIQPATADRYSFNGILRGTTKNAWFVTARMPGCDPAPVRFMITQFSDNSLQTIRVNRGASHAWESLLGDTLPAAQLAAIAALKRAGVNCTADEKPSLGIIRIASEEPGIGADTFGVRYSGGWAEIWPITACKRTSEVVVRFTADGDGGASTHIPGAEIRILP